MKNYHSSYLKNWLKFLKGIYVTCTYSDVLFTFLQIALAYLKVGLIFGHNIFGDGFVLAVDDVHVKFSLVPLEKRAQFLRLNDAAFKRLEEEAADIRVPSVTTLSYICIGVMEE
jgi:hypothetical protein